MPGHDIIAIGASAGGGDAPSAGGAGPPAPLPGLAAFRGAGGLALVRDPADADYPGMPRSAIENVAVDRVVPLSRIAETLVGLVGEPVAEAPPPSPVVDEELGEPGSLYGA